MTYKVGTFASQDLFKRFSLKKVLFERKPSSIKRWQSTLAQSEMWKTYEMFHNFIFEGEIYKPTF